MSSTGDALHDQALSDAQSLATISSINKKSSPNEPFWMAMDTVAKLLHHTDNSEDNAVQEMAESLIRSIDIDKMEEVALAKLVETLVVFTKFMDHKNQSIVHDDVKDRLRKIERQNSRLERNLSVWKRECERVRTTIDESKDTNNVLSTTNSDLQIRINKIVELCDTTTSINKPIIDRLAVKDGRYTPGPIICPTKDTVVHKLIDTTTTNNNNKENVLAKNTPNAMKRICVQNYVVSDVNTLQPKAITAAKRRKSIADVPNGKSLTCPIMDCEKTNIGNYRLLFEHFQLEHCAIGSLLMSCSKCKKTLSNGDIANRHTLLPACKDAPVMLKIAEHDLGVSQDDAECRRMELLDRLLDCPFDGCSYLAPLALSIRTHFFNAHNRTHLLRYACTSCSHETFSLQVALYHSFESCKMALFNYHVILRK